MSLSTYSLWQLGEMLIIPAFFATMRMLLVSGFLSTVFGLTLGTVLVVTERGGLCQNVAVNRVLDFAVNVIRSFPFLILMISIIPLTRLITGSSIGEQAAIVPLTVACTPFIARIVQNSLKEVDPAIVEAARSWGASTIQIIFKVLFKEAVPSIISGLCLALINLLGATAVAGSIGAGGLGAVALTYGYQNFNGTIMYSICAILVVLVVVMQYLGDWLYRRLK